VVCLSPKSISSGVCVMRMGTFWAVLALSWFASTATAADPPKRLLFVTHSGGFVHDSVYEAEKILKTIGPKNGFEVTCYRFTGDPDAKITVNRKVDGKDQKVETTALEDASQRFRR